MPFYIVEGKFARSIPITTSLTRMLEILIGGATDLYQVGLQYYTMPIELAKITAFLAKRRQAIEPNPLSDTYFLAIWKESDHRLAVTKPTIYYNNMHDDKLIEIPINFQGLSAIEIANILNCYLEIISSIEKNKVYLRDLKATARLIPPNPKYTSLRNSLVKNTSITIDAVTLQGLHEIHQSVLIELNEQGKHTLLAKNYIEAINIFTACRIKIVKTKITEQEITFRNMKKPINLDRLHQQINSMFGNTVVQIVINAAHQLEKDLLNLINFYSNERSSYALPIKELHIDLYKELLEKIKVIKNPIAYAQSALLTLSSFRTSLFFSLPVGIKGLTHKFIQGNKPSL